MSDAARPARFGRVTYAGVRCSSVRSETVVRSDLNGDVAELDEAADLEYFHRK